MDRHYLCAALLLAALTAALVAAGCDDASGERDEADGYALTDVPTDAESFSVTPSSIPFDDVPVGEIDVRAASVINGSTARLLLTRIALVDTDSSVRFANLFLQEVGEEFGWVDNDGDGHDFELRPDAIPVDPGGRFEIVFQYRPDGSLSQCLDRPPAPCGYLVVSGVEQTVSVPLFVPR